MCVKEDKAIISTVSNANNGCFLINYMAWDSSSTLRDMGHALMAVLSKMLPLTATVPTFNSCTKCVGGPDNT